MCWPISKKHDELEIPPKNEQRWSIIKGECAGEQIVVRLNESARELAGHASLPVKLGFAIPFNEPNEGGLPSPRENEQLHAVEDLISQRLLEAATGIHALTLTTGTVKEIVYYIAPGPDIAGLHQALRNEVSSHDVQCMAVMEPDWNFFWEFAP